MFFYKRIKFTQLIQIIQKKIYDARMKWQGWTSYCKHGVPVDQVFEYYGAVFQGGYCPNCGKLNHGKFLGNIAGMYEVVDGKMIPCKGVRSFSYFRKLGWKI